MIKENFIKILCACCIQPSFLYFRLDSSQRKWLLLQVPDLQRGREFPNRNVKIWRIYPSEVGILIWLIDDKSENKVWYY